MTITLMLTREQENALQALVTAGRFPTIEAAISFAVDHFSPPDLTDLSWAKPYIDEAHASLERGEGVPADEVFAEVDARLKHRGA